MGGYEHFRMITKLDLLTISQRLPVDRLNFALLFIPGFMGRVPIWVYFSIVIAAAITEIVNFDIKKRYIIPTDIVNKLSGWQRIKKQKTRDIAIVLMLSPLVYIAAGFDVACALCLTQIICRLYVNTLEAQDVQ